MDSIVLQRQVTKHLARNKQENDSRKGQYHVTVQKLKPKREIREQISVEAWQQISVELGKILYGLRNEVPKAYLSLAHSTLLTELSHEFHVMWYYNHPILLGFINLSCRSCYMYRFSREIVQTRFVPKQACICMHMHMCQVYEIYLVI